MLLWNLPESALSLHTTCSVRKGVAEGKKILYIISEFPYKYEIADVKAKGYGKIIFRETEIQWVMAETVWSSSVDRLSWRNNDDYIRLNNNFIM